MSALKSLIESGGECGTTNPVVDLARQLATQPEAPTMAMLGNSSTSFANGTNTESLLSNVGNSSFNMDNLLQEMSLMEDSFQKNLGNSDLTRAFVPEAVGESQLISNPEPGFEEKFWRESVKETEQLFGTIAIGRGQDNVWANDLVSSLTAYQEEDEVGLGQLEKEVVVPRKLFEEYRHQPIEPIRGFASEVGPVLSFEENQHEEERNATSVFSELKPAAVDPFASRESAFLENQFDDMEFWMKLAEDWNDQVAPSENKPKEMTAEEYLADFKEKVYPPLAELKWYASSSAYRFQKENVFDQEENHSKSDEFDRLMEEGIKRLAKGEVTAAILHFEAALKIRDDVANAWRMLGIAQAKNENDIQAIAAMKRCLALDGDNLDALMHLGISYTNESQSTLACYTLMQYLQKHPKFGEILKHTPFVPKLAGTPLTEPYQGPTPMSKRWSSPSNTPVKEKNIFVDGFYDYVIDGYRKASAAAAAADPSEVDPDIQCGLGVLFNLSGEYDKAVPYFRRALSKRPTDHLLWNRLGATLSNGGKSDEAIAAYRAALSCYPGYIRARYNLGISCILLDAPERAIGHLLTVLNMQAAGREPIIGMAPDNATEAVSRSQITSNNIWSTLRNAIMMIHRSDLYDAINRRDLNKLNEEFQQFDSGVGDEGYEEED